MTFSLNCYVYGDNRFDQTITVDLKERDNVFKLKEAIRSTISPRFDNIPATQLNLWQVDFSPEDDVTQWVPNIQQRLNAIKVVFNLFGKGSDIREDHIHIIVNREESVDVAGQLWLNCFILGQTSIFTVKISMGSNNVSILKDEIKAKNQNTVGHIDATQLKLWKVDNVPVADVSAVKTPTGTVMENADLLSGLFRPVLVPTMVHVIVDVPRAKSRGIADEGLKDRRDTVASLDRRFEKACKNIAKALAPSDSAKSSALPKSQLAYSIQDGRYNENVGPPIQLFHPVFGHFLDDVRESSDGDIPNDIIRNTTEYMKASSRNYPNELKRRMELNPILSTILGCNLQMVENDDGTKPDGILEGSIVDREGHHSYLASTKELKNEQGEGGSDASKQVSFCTPRTWVQPRFDKIRKATACPTFLMASAGPWFAVLGFIFTDCVIVQRLTDYIWVGIDSALSRSHVNRVARMFYALRTNIDRLNTYYKQLVIDTPKPGCSPYAPMRYFPSITSYYDDVQHKLVHFHYTGYLENGFDCVTLRANTSTEEQIVVKFVETYSDRAHRLLAGQRLAPKLHYFGSLQFDSKQPTYPKLSMVVMDYVDGKTFALAKPSMDKHATVKVKQEIIRALDLLHGNGLVFGDLRPPNVMVTKDGKGMLIDFDWAGVAGQVLYPHRLSPAVTWPEGVESLDPIEMSHDWDMLEKLFL